MNLAWQAGLGLAVVLCGCGGGNGGSAGGTGGTPPNDASVTLDGGGGQVVQADAAPPTPDVALPADAAGLPVDVGSPDATPPADAAVTPPDAKPAPDAAAPIPDAAATPADAAPTPDAGPVFPPQADNSLRINEFMASNHFTLQDDQGHTSDWLELYNGGDSDQNLEGYHLTDGYGADARSHVFAAGAAIAAHGYLVLWADGRSQFGPQHLRFNLPHDGGSIGLSRPDGTWIDRVDYGEQTPDISAARTPDGSDQWQTLWEVSPGAANPAGRGRPSRDEPRARPDTAPSYEQAVERLFNGLPEFHIEIDEAGMQSLRDNPRLSVPAFFTYEGRRIGPVGVHIKGQNSFLPIDQKPSLKLQIDFADSGARFHGLRLVTLNNMRSDTSMLKESVAYYMARTAGLYASRAGHALVYLNNDFYGVYTNLESVDSLFLDRWFADSTGSLWEGWDVDFRPGMVDRPCVDSDDPNRPGCYQIESGVDDRTALIGLTNALQEPAPQNMLDAGQYLSFEQFQLYWAVCANIGQFDSFPYSSPGDDYHVYVDPEAQQITFIPWGMDETFLGGRNVTSVTSILATTCLADPHCRDGWVQQVWLINDTMQAIDLAGEVDRVAALIAPYIDLDQHKPYSTAQVLAGQAEVRNFINGRAADLAAWLGPR